MGYIESNLVADEEILYTGRKHVILMLGQIVTEIILIGLTLVAFSVVSMVFTEYQMNQNTIRIIVYGALGLAITVLVVSGVLDYFKWYNDCVVITNRRMLRFEGLFNRHMVESVLDKINDVSLNQTLWGRLFGYGDVTVLTAAESGVQEMRNIANPFGFKQALFQARSMKEEALYAKDDDADHHVVARHENDDAQAHEEEHHHADDDAHDIQQEVHDVDGFVPTPPHGNEESDDAHDQGIDEAAELERATILQQLEILHAKGILDDEEFYTKRQRLYGKDV
jgi:uncharacterized membrane protein YdbT with pleckstrin-like domain